MKIFYKPKIYVIFKKKKISFNNFQNKIADSKYDIIRAKLALSNEGILADFANSNPNDALLFE